MLPEGTSAFKLILADTAPAVLEGWRNQFLKWPEVEVRAADVLETAADAMLLPGNSFGFLDGGLALRVLEHGGWELEEELRQQIRSDHHGELLVGQAIVLRRKSLPWAIVYAPIWRTPRHLKDTVNVFLAARAAFIAVKAAAEPIRSPSRSPIRSIVLPAMGVDPGGLDPRVSARQIRYAYEMETARRAAGDKNLSQIQRRERKLQSIPETDKAD